MALTIAHCIGCEQKGNTYLMREVVAGRAEHLEALIAIGAEVNHQNNVCQRIGHDVVLLVLSLGPDYDRTA